jgi:hypothetical protein
MSVCRHDPYCPGYPKNPRCPETVPEGMEVKVFTPKPRREQTRIERVGIWVASGMQHPKDIERKSRSKARAKGRVARKSRRKNR